MTFIRENNGFHECEKVFKSFEGQGLTFKVASHEEMIARREFDCKFVYNM